MIDDTTKTKIIKELEKNGNVWIVCIKSNIARSTYYRWKKEDQKFAKQANTAIQMGHENISDIAEHALMQNVKNKDMSAIKYVLSHNSPRYRSQSRKIYIEHINKSKDRQMIGSIPKEDMDRLDEIAADIRKSIDG